MARKCASIFPLQFDYFSTSGSPNLRKTPESRPRINVTGLPACYSFQTHFEFWGGTTSISHSWPIGEICTQKRRGTIQRNASLRGALLSLIPRALREHGARPDTPVYAFHLRNELPSTTLPAH